MKVFCDKCSNTFVNHCISIRLEHFRQPRLRCFYMRAVCTSKARTMSDRRQFLLQVTAELASSASDAIRIDRTLLGAQCRVSWKLSECFCFWSVGSEALHGDSRLLFKLLNYLSTQ